MHIALDVRAWKWTGVGRYIRNVVRQYAVLPHGHTFTLLVPRGDEWPEGLRDIIQKHPDRFKAVEVEPSYYSWQEQLLYPFELSRLDVDLFHFPHFNVPLAFNRPYVVTIHDTTRFVIPGQRRQGLLNQIAYETVFRHAVASAKHIISVSKHTAFELRNLPFAPSDIETTVIYEGVDDQFFVPPADLEVGKMRALLGTDSSYLLHVGVWMSHKNLERLLRAFKQVVEKRPDLKLVVTGKPVPMYSNLLKLIQELGVENSVVFPGFVPDDLLPALYSQAEMLVFPSLYEGFGLPAIEAAAVGTPVVCSNVTSLPEIMNDGAFYVNPEDVDDIARGIERVLGDGDLRAQVISHARQRVAEFRWDVCAKETLKLYKLVLT